MYNRTLYLFYGILLAISSGSVSIYPIYSFYIKNRYNYSLREINLYGSFINIGCWVAFGMGIIYDTLGPIVSNVIGFILLPGGFIVLNNLIQSSYSSISLLWFLLIAFIMGQGSALIYTNALSTNIKNFSKKNSSNIVGLIVSNCAIAPSLFASFKAAFHSMTIPDFISFVIFIISVIILFSCCYFRVIKEKKIYDFDKKVYNLNKQTFILGLFIYTNFIGLLIFIITLIINHLFHIELPAFMIFPVIHIIFIVFICMEKCHKFEDYFDDKYKQNHINNINYFENFDRVKDVPLEEAQNKFDDKNNKENSELKNSPFNKINDENEEKEDNKAGRYTQNEHISRMSNKLEFNNDNQEEMNKKENSEDIHMSKNSLKITFKNNGNENDDNNKKSEGNNNINNEGEYNGEENGRLSNNNDVNENNRNSVNNDNDNINGQEEKDDNDREDENKINNKEEKIDNVQEIEGCDDEKEKEKENNIQDENNNDEKGNEGKEEENNKDPDKNNNENNDNDNNDNYNENNGNSNENNIKNSYPKFSINSNEGNTENKHNENNEGENFKSNYNNINIPNPYPKFSINSNDNDNGNGIESGLENPYPKFSITKDEKENENENNNNENNNKIIKDNENNSKNENLKDDEKNKDKSKDDKIEEVNSNIIFNRKLQKSSSKKKILDIEKKDDYNTTVNDYNNTTNAIIMSNNISPLEMNPSLDEDDEKEESHNKCVLLLSLFRKPQIIKFFFVLLLTMGCMISNINNIKFIVSSISSDHSLNLVSLDKYPLIYFSFNSLSRVITGSMVKELMGGEYTFYCLYITEWLGLISQLIGCILTKFTIYISISLAGITHGSIMTFTPLYCRYYYSVNDLGTVLGFLTTGNAIGSILIATLIFPHFYHENSQYDKYTREEYCSGKICFRKSYLINSCFMLIALILSYSLYINDKKKKLKEKEDRMNMYKNSAFCSFNPRVSQGSDNSNQAV